MFNKMKASALLISFILFMTGCGQSTPSGSPGGSAEGGTASAAVEGETAQEASAGEQKEAEEPSNPVLQPGDAFDYEEGDENPAGELPSKYDLREVTVKGSGIVPPIRFQNPFGTCWGHGAIAAAEISILGSGLAQEDGYTAETFDLSEKHLAVFSYTALDDPTSSQNGEGAMFSPAKTSSQKMKIGGQVRYATSLFAAGIGPNLEDRDGLDEGDEEVLVYKGRNEETESRIVTWFDEENVKHSGVRRFCYSSDDNWDIPEKYRFYQSYRLKDSYILPCPSSVDYDYDREATYTYNPEGTEAIKRQLMAKRGVTISSAAESSRPVPTNGYRHWGIEQEKNKHNGYFWISYYDWTLDDPEAFVFDKSNVGKSYYVQQYDYMPASYVRKFEDDAVTQEANVFKIDRNAKLTEISVVTTSPNSEVSYDIYLLRDKYTSPVDGIKIQSGEGNVFEYGGYHRIELASPVSLFRDQTYSVVVAQKAPSGKYVFGVVCGKGRANTSEEPEALPEEDAAGGYTAVTGEAAAAEEAASDETAGGAGTGKAAEEEPEPEEEAALEPENWDEIVLNKKESYLMTGDRWYDLTRKEAKDIILQKDETGNCDYDCYDNLPIKAYLTEADQTAYPDPMEDITINTQMGDGTKQIIFKLKGRVEEWDTNPNFTWESSDSSIFTVDTVDPEEGVYQINGIHPGKAYLTISSEELGTRVVGVTVE